MHCGAGLRRRRQERAGKCARTSPIRPSAGHGTPSTRHSSACSAAGHLRATATGVALHPPQLDQTKVPSTDFRTESATIDARQRLKLCRLFQTAGVDCKPNEETAAAGRLLSHLERPCTQCRRGRAAAAAPRYPASVGAIVTGRERAVAGHAGPT